MTQSQVEINNTTKQRINSRRITTLAQRFLRVYKKNWTISVAVIGAKKMRTINRNYRGVYKTTDVLSFPEVKEILINIEETKKATKYFELFGRLEKSEYIFDFLLVHGLLHLVGYNDKTEKGRQKMVALGAKFLRSVL